MGKESRLTFFEAVFLVGCLFALVVLVIPTMLSHSGPGRPELAQCVSNLHNIGIGLGMYQADYGTWPTQPTNAARLGIIRGLYVDSDEMFQCPAVRSHKFSFGATKREVIGTDYYLEGPIPANADPMRAVAGDYNKDGMNHKGKKGERGSVILFFDTNVHYVRQNQNGQHPNKYIALDKDIYAIDTQPRDKDDADLD